MKVDDYGIGTDQKLEEEILFMNLQAYAYAILGDDSGYADGLGDRDVFTDIERDHGASALYILAPLTFVSGLRNNPNAWIVVYRLTIWLIVFVSLIAFYKALYLCLGKRFVSITATIAMWISPRFFAESSYNNKDMTAAALVIITFYVGYRFVIENRNEYLWPIIFGLVSAMSTNMRFTGIIVWGIIGITFISRGIIAREMPIQFWTRGLTALVSMPFFYYLLTPAMWKGNAKDFLAYLLVNSGEFKRTSVYTLVNGVLYNSIDNPNTRAYLLEYIFVTVPIVFLFAIVGGLLVFIHKLVKRKKLNVFLTMNAMYIVIMMAVVAVANPVLYNGWRHMYFLSGPMFVFLAFFLHCFWNSVSLYHFIKIICGIAIWGQIIFCGCFIIIYFPNEFSFYNVFAGTNTSTNWDGDYWGIGAKTVISELNRMSDSCTILVRESFVSQNLEYMESDVTNSISIGWFDTADYVVVNNCNAQYFIMCPYTTWSVIEHDSTIFWEQIMLEEPIFTVDCGKQTLWSVYENPLKAN